MRIRSFQWQLSLKSSTPLTVWLRLCTGIIMFILHLISLIGVAIMPRIQASSVEVQFYPSHNLRPAQAACRELQTRYPAATHFSNTSAYATDNTDYWSQASALGPACIFAPSLVEELGEAVKVLIALRSPFAMRGGGHMPIRDFNNINSTGVLFSSSGFKRLEMAADGESVHVGPSNHWSDVYEFLEPHGKVVVGGRLRVVGVPGFVMGGGASFFSAEYGWASNNVKSYTVSVSWRRTGHT
jgi:FAD/FMN-containing dehydrogenase